MLIKNSKSVFRSICLFVLAAVLCLSLVFMTGCGKTESGSDAPAKSGDEQKQEESDDSGFVVEDSTVVDVDVDDEQGDEQ